MIEFDHSTAAFHEPGINQMGYEFVNADVSDRSSASATLKRVKSILKTVPYRDRAVVFLTADFPRNKLRRQIDNKNAKKESKREMGTAALGKDGDVEKRPGEGAVFDYDKCDNEDIQEMLLHVSKIARVADRHNRRLWSRGKDGKIVENRSFLESRFGVRGFLQKDVTRFGNVRSTVSGEFIPCPVTVLVSFATFECYLLFDFCDVVFAVWWIVLFWEMLTTPISCHFWRTSLL